MWKEWETKSGKEMRCPKSGGKWRRGRPRMGREDCGKRDLERVGGEQRKTAKDRRNYRLIIENIVREHRVKKQTKKRR